MTAPFSQEGLSTLQAPPLRVPGTFFVIAAFFVLVAGVAITVAAETAFASNWLPTTIAITHLLTLGFISNTMCGALYQMIPVVGGARVPMAEAGVWVAYGIGCGVLLLTVGISGGQPLFVDLALWVLGPALAFFVLTITLALTRAPAKTPTITGIKLAIAALLLAATVGLWMAHGHAGYEFPGDRRLFIAGHVATALGGWVGGLLVAVSWQVVPMFYLAAAPSRQTQLILLGCIATAVILPSTVTLFSTFVAPLPDLFFLIAGAPGLLGALLLHPLATLRSLWRRKRRRRDHTVRFWQTGLFSGLLGSLAIAVALFTGLQQLWFCAGWLLVWGWAGAIMHGMLYRIVPFLVWFNRMSPLLGRAPTLTTRQLLPDKRIRLAWLTHCASLATGVVACLFVTPLTAQIAGVLLTVAGGMMLFNISRVLLTDI